MEIDYMRQALNNLIKHKVFISYYHEDDQAYKDAFEKWFKDIFINKSVGDGDINTDVSTDYVKRLIQEDYLSDSSVLIVLCGPNTKYRKHVDWEISAALSSKVGGYSGLIGIILPEFPLNDNKYNPDDLPKRLNDNVETGYAKLYTWNDACSSIDRIKQIIQTAFDNKKQNANLIDNSRLQMQRNLN